MRYKEHPCASDDTPADQFSANIGPEFVKTFYAEIEKARKTLK